MDKQESIRVAQEHLYRSLYETHRGTPMAVSSESLDHKKLRFSILSEVFSKNDDFSIHDVGCGLADYGAYLRSEFPERKIVYSGTEILPEFQADAEKRFPDSRFYLRDLAEKPGSDRYDYLIMSGIFHQRRATKIPAWEAFALSLLENTFQMAHKGIAFNFTSPFVDFYQEGSYYCNLTKLIQFINDRLSRFFEIRHNYALFELTVFVYQPEFIRQKYPQAAFEKYFRR